MDSYDARRVLESAITKLDSPKGWLVVVGSIAGMYVLSKGLFKMDSYDARRTLEKAIDRVGKSKS